MSVWNELLERLAGTPRENGTPGLEQATGWLVATLEAAGLEPDYDQLILPRQLDEMAYEIEGDRQRHGFNRILWDSSQGNPAVALRLWRDSMVVTLPFVFPGVAM